jgi:hypothetical protein
MGHFEAGLHVLEYMRKLDAMSRTLKLAMQGPSMPFATGQADATLLRLGSTFEAASAMRQQFDRIEQARRFPSQLGAAMESVRMADVERALNLAFGTYSTLLRTAAQQPLPADFTVIGRRPETESVERDAHMTARELLELTGLDAEDMLAEARAVGESDLAEAVRTYQEVPSADVSVVVEKADLDRTNELLHEILDEVRAKKATFGASEWIEVATLLFIDPDARGQHLHMAEPDPRTSSEIDGADAGSFNSDISCPGRRPRAPSSGAPAASRQVRRSRTKAPGRRRSAVLRAVGILRPSSMDLAPPAP